MADQQQVNPVEGLPAPAAPGPAPIPRRVTRFREAAQFGTRIPPSLPAFPVSQGISPLLTHAEGYTAVEVPRSGLNTDLPSYLNAVLRVFLMNQKLAVDDKFLKEVSLYHPDAFDLYCSFLFVYQTIRVRAEVGQLSAAESTLLSDMLREYPPTSLPVPGGIVDTLQTLTATENPYPWLGNICTALPEPGDFRAPAQAYLLNQNRFTIWPNFKFLISQLVASAARAYPTEQSWNTLHGLRFTSPGAANGNTNQPAAIRTDSAERTWLWTPHGRVPMILNLRVAQAFHNAVNGSANAPFYSDFAIDLPQLNAITSPANGTLPTYLGLTDDEGVAPRVTRYRRWPTQLASMCAIACKYISGSRHLSDIATTGLGALHHIASYTASMILEDRDPHDVQGGAHAIISTATYQEYLLDNLNATLEVRDPVASDLSIQYQMLAQTNVSLRNVMNKEDTQFLYIPLPRIGPFWTYAIGENGPEAAVANILMSHLPNFVKSNPRRDAAE